MNFKSYSEKESKSKKHTQKWVIRGWASQRGLRLNIQTCENTDMATMKEYSDRIKERLSREFPECKFSVKADKYGGELMVYKAPKSWYADDILDDEEFYMVFIRASLTSGGKLTPAGEHARKRLTEIMLEELKDVTSTRFDENTYNYVPYRPKVYMFGGSHILKLFNDNSMNGHRTRAPAKKHSPAVKVNVRKMF